jgi:hypothetical protein
MMLTGISAALALLFVPQVAVDSAAAVRQARQLVREHYDTTRIRASDERACTGTSLRDCMSGDWNCEDHVCPSDLDERRVPLIEPTSARRHRRCAMASASRISRSSPHVSNAIRSRSKARCCRHTSFPLMRRSASISKCTEPMNVKRSMSHSRPQS